jgi:hypothetical protein
MTKNRLEAFSDGVIAIMWIIPDKNIEKALSED